jgi:hypothetical protein
MQHTADYDFEPRCEAEIESRFGLLDWHACGRPAVVFSRRELATGAQYDVHFCKRHAHRAKQSLARIVCVGEVRQG